MSNIFSSIFGKKEKKTKIYNIEINDEEINENISQILLRLQEKMKRFKSHLDVPNMYQKEDDFHELYKEILAINESVKEVSNDVEKIISLEVEAKDFFIIKDDTFLLDKRTQLKEIMEAVHSFLTIIQQNPSVDDLRKELLQKLIEEINRINLGLNKIIKDDMNLHVIYKKLAEL